MLNIVTCRVCNRWQAIDRDSACTTVFDVLNRSTMVILKPLFFELHLYISHLVQLQYILNVTPTIKDNRDCEHILSAKMSLRYSYS
jgi:hypothetical protein